VRWREAGRNRSRRFVTLGEAEAFDAARRTAGVEADVPLARAGHRSGGDGIYPYETTAGIRYRFSFRQSDGTLSTRRGFTSRRAAATARRRLVESIERGEVKVARETFGTFWTRFLDERRAYLTKGSIADLESHGRKRLLPAFGDVPIARLDEAAVRRWMTEMVKHVETGRISAKTINNARTCLSVALNEACRRGLVPRNVCAGVPALPVERTELEYLRLGEIHRYLDACAPYYVLLARFLIGTGARISEALGLRFGDLDLEHGIVRIHQQRDRGRRWRQLELLTDTRPRSVPASRPRSACCPGRDGSPAVGAVLRWALGRHAAGVDPRSDIAGNEPHRAVGATEPDTGNPPGLGRLVQPRAGDPEHLDDVAGPQQPVVRMIRAVHSV
jgi:integrase